MSQLLEPYNPTLRQRLGDHVYNLARLFGLDGQAHRMRTEAQSAMDFVPGLGEAIGGQEAAIDYGRGDLLGAVLGATATGLGAVPVVGDVAGKAIRKGIRAYHGSPHDFDRFSMEKIGAGEGNQSYGHGLYFAEKEGTAQFYRKALSHEDSDPKYYASQNLKRGADKGILLQTLEENSRNPKFPEEKRKFWAEAAASIRSGEAERYGEPGRMYEVNIDANPDDFLDWDKPLAHQPANIQKIAREADLSHLKPGNRTRVMLEKWRAGVEQPEYKATGQTLHNALSDYGADANPALSSELKELGFPGIKYLDQGSRTAGDGTRNYVVFDDKLISIVRKYGIAGAIGLGYLTAEQGEALASQGYR